MKKRASKSKPAARKSAAKASARKKPAAAKSSARAATAPRGAAAPGRREQAAIEAAKYTPAPLRSTGWPAFRYPLS
ncbi:MAG TPA: hypothetical protein VGU22_14415 [Methylomirabilota bacterium]|jgi:hypothetical protein|nr:hypothetical protein [Methylomirabilota bacterium]